MIKIIFLFESITIIVGSLVLNKKGTDISGFLKTNGIIVAVTVFVFIIFLIPQINLLFQVNKTCANKYYTSRIFQGKILFSVGVHWCIKYLAYLKKLENENISEEQDLENQAKRAAELQEAALQKKVQEELAKEEAEQSGH